VSPLRRNGWSRNFSRLRSGQLLIISFLSAILVGAALLMLPFAAVDGRLSAIDALFTSTSAICVTGLTVVDTGSRFTFFGKIVILLLIQAGGLGIMTFSVLMFLALGQIPPLRDRWLLESTYAWDSRLKIWSLVKSIFVFTLISETAGAVVLAWGWQRTGMSLAKSAWNGIFHSVSAFCNAGFGLFPDSLESFRSSWLIILTVGGLIILGGIGFAVAYELFTFTVDKRRRRISLHTRIVLLTTFGLIVSAMLMFAYVESGNAFAGMSWPDRLVQGFFQGVTARTAGFDSVSIAAFSNASIMVFILLMFVGASPGSCGGGVKTTSFFLIFALLINRLRGSRHINVQGRTVPEITVRRVVSLIVLGLIVIFVSTLLLLLTQSAEFIHPKQRDLFVSYLFESFSALGTVGLSLGVTAGLDSFGKLVVIGLMFVGRVGLITFAYGLIRHEGKGKIEYAGEDVMI